MNRSLSFIRKYWNGVVPGGRIGLEIESGIENLYKTTGGLIEKGLFKDAVSGIFEYVRRANKYFDTEAPWITRLSDEAACQNTLYQCVQIIANLAVLLKPFLPFSSEKVCSWLGLTTPGSSTVFPEDIPCLGHRSCSSGLTREWLSRRWRS